MVAICKDYLEEQRLVLEAGMRDRWGLDVDLSVKNLLIYQSLLSYERTVNDMDSRNTVARRLKVVSPGINTIAELY